MPWPQQTVPEWYVSAWRDNRFWCFEQLSCLALLQLTTAKLLAASLLIQGGLPVIRCWSNGVSTGCRQTCEHSRLLSTSVEQPS